MTPQFLAVYRPLTARPFLHNHTYEEYLPCKQLRPYVVCFWASEGMSEGIGASEDIGTSEGISTPECMAGDRGVRLIRVIPDTCVDIILELDYTNQVIKSKLCGIQDDTVMAEQKTEGRETVRFAARFPFWAARRFLNLDMSGLCNQNLDLELLMPGCNRRFEELFYCRSIEARIGWMESYLLGIFKPEGYNPNLYNAIEYLLRQGGRASVRDICGYSAVSQRQLERLFKQETGISIKRTASLVRYQNVWREIVRQDKFNIQEAVGRYGYADQSHLLNEFKRFHGLYPSQAKQEALKNR